MIKSENRQFLLAMACALGLGVSSYLYGSASKEAEWQAKVTDAASKAQQAANTQAINSSQVSAHVDAKTAASTNSINAISSSVAERLTTNEPRIIYRTAQCPRPESDQPGQVQAVDDAGDSVAPWRFDVNTVRLLNTARLGLSAEPATLGHAEGDDQPSTVGIGEFADNDLQVVARYHALKIKHDALVDWVNQLKEQNLGLCVASEPLYSQHLEDP